MVNSFYIREPVDTTKATHIIPPDDLSINKTIGPFENESITQIGLGMAPVLNNTGNTPSAQPSFVSVNKLIQVR